MKRQEFLAAATEIRILMTILTKLTRQELQEHLDRCGMDMSTLDHGVMRLLRHYPFTISELSKHMLVEPATLVPVVDELERKQWIRRTTDPNDRRRTPLVLTAEGEQLLAALPGMPMSGAFTQTLERMGDDKVQDLLERLRELTAGMSEDKRLVPELSKSVRMQVSKKEMQGIERKKAARNVAGN